MELYTEKLFRLIVIQEIRDIRRGGDDVRPLDAALERALRLFCCFSLVSLPKCAAKNENARRTKYKSEPHPTTTGFKGKGRER